MTEIETTTYTCPSGHEVLFDGDVVPPGSLSVGSHGYAQFWNGETTVLLHRWLLGLETGDKRVGDHINRNVMDCRRANLRAVTPTESNLNREVARRDLPIGIYRIRSGRFQARIKREGTLLTVGSFDTVEEARSARNVALLQVQVLLGWGWPMTG